MGFKQIDFTVDKSDWIIEFELLVWKSSRLDQRILLRNRLCIPKLVRQDNDAECDQKGDENEYSSNVRPHIHEFIVAREETPAQRSHSVMIDPVSAEYEPVVQLMFRHVINGSDVGLDLRLDLRVPLAYLVRHIRSVLLYLLGPLGKCVS